MKNLNKILSTLFILALFAGFTSCVEGEDYTPASALSEANETVYFDEETDLKFEFEPDAPTTITLQVARKKSTNASQVPIAVLVNDDNVFQIPSAASFAAGASTTEIDISFPNAVIGKAYTFEIAIDGEDYVDSYQALGTNSLTVEVSRVKWDIFAEGTFTASMFGSWPTTLYKEDGEDRYRIQLFTPSGNNFVFRVNADGKMTPVGLETQANGYYVWHPGISIGNYGEAHCWFDSNPEWSLFDLKNKTIYFSFQYRVSVGNFGWVDDVFTWE